MADISATEIPKPLDWQAFQRACVPLFRALIRDERLQEFGREGQTQHGIDLLGNRDGDSSYPVGIQCRRYENPLKEEKIRKDAEAARAITPPLRELIFASTAPRDQKLQAAAAKLSNDLHESGWECRVTVMAWPDLQLEIINHPPALKAFWPSAFLLTEPTILREAVESGTQSLSEKLDEQSALIHELFKRTVPIAPDEFEADLPAEARRESLAIHTRIAGIRDLIKKGKAKTALEALDELNRRSDLQPYAKYRVLSNIGLIYFNAGNNGLALKHLGEAHELRPNDPKSNVNLAYAELVDGQVENARQRASSVLKNDPNNALASSLLIQSYSRDSSGADPLSLVPESVRGAVEVKLAEILFLRAHDNPDWRSIAKEAHKQHPNDRYLKRFSAEATLEIALSDRDGMFGKKIIDIAPDEIKESAETLENLWREEMSAEIPRVDEIFPLAANASAALRFMRNDNGAAKLLDETLEKVGRDPVIVRSRALLYLHEGRDQSALDLLEPEVDPESMLLFAQISAAKEPDKALRTLTKIDITVLPEQLKPVPLEIKGEIALTRGDAESLKAALVGLKNQKVAAIILRARGIMRGLITIPAPGGEPSEDEQLAALADIVSQLPKLEQSLQFADRLQLAQFLDRNDAHEEASNLLYGQVALDQDSVGLRTYLGASIGAQLYARVREALSQMPKALLSDPAYTRMVASYYWNSGDAKAAEPYIARLVKQHPTRLDLLLWHIDALLRIEKGDEVTRLLKDPIENTLEGTLNDKKRLVAALNTYGENVRAREYAYRLFALNRDDPEAWMAFIGAMLSGESSQRDEILSDVIGNDHAFDVERGGDTRHYVIEQDKELRRVNQDAIDPDHQIAKAVQGLKPGDTLKWPTDGSTAKIKSAKHKLLDALHDAMGQFNDRFPTASGFKQVSVGSSEKFDPSEIEAMLRKRSAYISEQSAKYEANEISLSMLAYLTGVDPIDAMIGLGELGRTYRVAIGTEEERNFAFRFIGRNQKAGCVVDAPTYHCIRRLNLEAIVEKICGPIGISQVTMDIYNHRLQSLCVGGKAVGSMSLRNNAITVTEYSEAQHDETKRLIESDKNWLCENAQVLPAQAADDPPAFLRRFSSMPGARFFDDIYAASGSNRLLLVDDLFTRQVASQLGVPSTNLQPVLMTARVRGILSHEDYARAITDFIDIGQHAIAIDRALLMSALSIDVKSGSVIPGMRLNLATRMLGGAASDPISHSRVAAEFIYALLNQRNPASADYAAVSQVLTSVLRGQVDYREMLNMIAANLKGHETSTNYLVGWARGHFFSWPYCRWAGIG